VTEPDEEFELRVAASAARALDRLPTRAAAAIVEFAVGPLLRQPRRVGKPLGGKQAGRWSARRGPYRLIYEIDEENKIVRVLHAAHRADVYRPR